MKYKWNNKYIQYELFLNEDEEDSEEEETFDVYMGRNRIKYKKKKVELLVVVRSFELREAASWNTRKKELSR